MSVRDNKLVLQYLTVSFDGFKALNKLSLHVEPGELLCIIGPNGAGKTTMMDVVTAGKDCGLAVLNPSNGRIHVSDFGLEFV